MDNTERSHKKKKIFSNNLSSARRLKIRLDIPVRRSEEMLSI